jgi:alpha-galactosidase
MKLRCGFSFLLSVSFCTLTASSLHAQAADIAATPPMGWNSWKHFRNKVDDATIRSQAEAMVSSGMRDAGYTYVNIDDTWRGIATAAV